MTAEPMDACPSPSGQSRFPGVSPLSREPMDRSRVADARVQDWNCLTGARRVLPAVVPDSSAGVINVNTLKFERKQAYTIAQPQDGGATNSASTCLGNWVEERKDANYRSGTHPKELNNGRLYQTDYSDNFKPSSDQYLERVKTMYGTAKFPQITGAKRSHSGAALGDFTGTHVYYSRAGFGSEPQQDHTPDARKGAFWVGTAPQKQYESIAMTASRQQAMEFQGRCSTQDGESMLLLKTKPLNYSDAGTAKVAMELIQSQKWTTNWETTNKSDFVRHNLR